ncbi:8-amino-7-oxononanoate synthase [Desulforhopalus sp. IMCC35007]|uniref:aminotransferase class I/II-fold pyridoxal phosphate-dependent enzyme n=1 Tax=Desulforhopalus sp. IMCC35007 TaxID=2569543 RepID=UPI0010AE08E9|nr:8-amino-7-oxononanoate synthase [Desulforhopalus sp. IMCC35007]TKB09335.1 8-amino-7-oxononanoate synthase [Desulforhopalus sp. IMCC35007]
MKTYEDALKNLTDRGRLREFLPIRRDGHFAQSNGRKLLNLCSNDYLGIAGDSALQKKFYAQQKDEGFLDQFGLGAASSRLLTGDYPGCHQLEKVIADAYDKEACLLFNSGYHANIGILPALFGKKDLILSDKLNHASLTDGIRLSRASYKRYRHCDYSHLDDLLGRYRTQFDRAVIVSESIFSMDGDRADIEQMVRLKDKYDCLLYIDEAHALGVYGPNGLGLCADHGYLADIDLLVGTFGKALGSLGAFLLSSHVAVQYLINSSRSLIFTTALPPVVTSWNLFVFQEMLNYEEQRKQLRENSEKLRARLEDNKIKTGGSTHIVPVHIGDDRTTVRLAKEMQSLGYLVLPVRPPTVPEGESRFRLSVTADMEWLDLEKAVFDLARIFKAIDCNS